MHDPLVVAFEIRRPWPQRSGPFWMLAGRCWYWPALITVWHREPGGKDSGTVCRHYRRTQGVDGKWHTTVLHAWRWHVHHWRIQVHPLQALRRWALTRCAWCGGRSSTGDAVNVSHSWDGPRGRWWRGESGLFHRDCSSVQHTHGRCLCDMPLPEHGNHGKCLACGKVRPYGSDVAPADVLLASLPAGSRITEDIRPEVERLWAAARAEAR